MEIASDPYVRRSTGGIGDVTRAASTIGERLGMEVKTQIGQHPKIYYRALRVW